MPITIKHGTMESDFRYLITCIEDLLCDEKSVSVSGVFCLIDEIDKLKEKYPCLRDTDGKGK